MTLSKDDQALLEQLHKELKPEADVVAMNHVLSRTPAHLQDAMKQKLGVPTAAPAPPPHPAPPAAYPPR